RRAVPPPAGASALATLARRARAAGTAAPAHAPGAAADQRQGSHLRPADTVGRPHLAPAPAPRRRDDIARASRHARGLATLDQRVSGADRLPRRTDRGAGRRAATVRPGRPARGAAGHDPRRRRAARPDNRGRDRRDQPLRRSEKLVSYGRLAPRVRQSGEGRPHTGPLNKSGSRLLGWAAVEAAQQAWRETNPWHQL